MSEVAAAFLRARRRPLELVIFDCDGVLIDSEALCNRVVAEILTQEGWAMTAEECERRFIGMSFWSMRPEIESRLGRSLGDDWVDRVVSVHGVTAARAAGMDCLGLARHHDGAALRAAGAVVFRSMHDLPALLRTALC